MKHPRHTLILISLSCITFFLTEPDKADGLCNERPTQPAELSIIEKARQAVLAFLPGTNDQWTMVEEFIEEVQPTVCREYDAFPVQYSSQRRYVKTGQGERDKKSVANMEHAADRIKLAQEKNRARLEQIDREIGALTAQTEKAGQQQDVAAIQRLAAKIQALTEEKNRLMETTETMENLEQSEMQSRQDTRLSIEVFFNPQFFSFVHTTKTVPLAGADIVVVMATPGPVKEGENGEMVILLGRWKSANGAERWDATFNPGIPRTRVQTIAVRILANEQRLISVAKQLPLGKLRALIGQ